MSTEFITNYRVTEFITDYGVRSLSQITGYGVYYKLQDTEFITKHSVSFF